MVAAPTSTLPQAGQTVTFTVAGWLAKKNGLLSRELEGIVLRATPRALEVRATAVIRESQWCLCCGKGIVNPVSQLGGYALLLSNSGDGGGGGGGWPHPLRG